MAPPSLSKNRKQLVRRITALVEASSLLREKLERYEQAMFDFKDGIDKGETALDATKGATIPSGRRTVTTAIDEFEAVRHQLRLALFSVGREEGASISDVGRALGISRQLASRLAAEATQEAEAV
jgi:hypothetical protein